MGSARKVKLHRQRSCFFELWICFCKFYNFVKCVLVLTCAVFHEVLLCPTDLAICERQLICLWLFQIELAQCSWKERKSYSFFFLSENQVQPFISLIKSRLQKSCKGTRRSHSWNCGSWVCEVYGWMLV